MRIIAGEARGRRLAAVRGREVRPTGDRVREALFSLLLARAGLPDPETTVVLDLYAGSGALGLEALSRGAVEAHFVEVDVAAAATVQENQDTCGFADRGRVHRSSVSAFLARGAGGPAGCELIFMDPPYAAAEGLIASLTTLALPLMAPDAVVVAEHQAKQQMPDAAGCLRLVHRRIWGDTAMSFYRPEAASSTW